ncbi:MAG: hypothetical protein KKG59_02135 [Nanoarchaeota archaeon]|nr:hypothetical protein [Nanoarchaeota archaeon]
MNGEDYLQKLIEAEEVARKEACRDNVIMLGNALVTSFGMDDANPTNDPDHKRGYQGASRFLKSVCDVFEDPSHLVQIAPFSYTYLGPQTFRNVLQTVVKRASTHPEEQPMLDEVFTATALLQPRDRDRFLRDVQSARTLGSGDIASFSPLDDMVRDIDPLLVYDSTAEFPSELETADVRQAAEKLGAFLQMGVFLPGEGFTEKYSVLRARMKGFDYLIQKPEANFAVLVSRDRDLAEDLGNMLVYERTPEADARPNNSGKNPSLVMVNEAVPPESVERLYKDSTVFYIARTKKQAGEMRKALGDDKQALLVDISDTDRYTAKNRLQAHINFISEVRNAGSTIDFNQMLEEKLEEARDLAANGNEYFYDVRDIFENLGRRQVIDDMVNAEGHALPPRTDYELIMLLSDKRSDLEPYFETARKKVKHFRQVPDIAETGMPFVIITNQPTPLVDLKEQFPSGTIIYLARTSDEEQAILAVNPEENAFILRADEIQRATRRRDPHNVGRNINSSYFRDISESRGKGVTDMMEVAQGISTKVKEARDKILFAPRLREFYDAGKEYYNLQQKYAATPIMLQLTDGVLMETCPTGGCFKLDAPETGGCCGGGNLPDVLIDFAVAYRKQVGEKRFAAELEAHNKKADRGGRVADPWYAETRQYQREFQGGLLGKAKRKARDIMEF